jgi:hypothetical protein
VALLYSKEELAEEAQRGQTAGRELGIKVLPAEHTPTDYNDAFALIAREHPDAMVVGASAANVANRHLIVEFAAQRRLPGQQGLRRMALGGNSPAGKWNSPRRTCRAADRSRGCPSSDCKLRPVDGEDMSHGNRKN